MSDSVWISLVYRGQDWRENCLKEWYEFIQKTVILDLLREHTLTVQTYWRSNRIIDTVALTIYTVFRVIQSQAVRSGSAENLLSCSSHSLMLYAAYLYPLYLSHLLTLLPQAPPLLASDYSSLLD